MDNASAITHLFDVLLGAARTIGMTASALFLAWAGFLYMTAGGSPRRMESAKDAAFAAVGGLAIVLLASAIAGLINGAFQTAH
jgi:hypothetical protein